MEISDQQLIVGGFMNIGSAAELIHVRYVSSEGSVKEFETPKDRSPKAFMADNLLDYKCVVCWDVNEKTLQTRCCQALICASCYLSLPSPKTCPMDRSKFNGLINDLEVAGRHIDNQVDKFCTSIFIDVQSTGTDEAKSQNQNRLITQLTRDSTQSTNRTRQSTRENVSTINTGRLGNNVSSENVAVSSQYSASDSMHVSDDTVIIGSRNTIRRNSQGSNLDTRNGREVSGQNSTGISPPSRAASSSAKFNTTIIEGNRQEGIRDGRRESGQSSTNTNQSSRGDSSAKFITTIIRGNRPDSQGTNNISIGDGQTIYIRQ